MVAELGLADLLRDGPLNVDALAEKTDTHAPTLYRVLRALSSVGIFVETKERMFGLRPLAQCLLSDAMRPIARMFLSGWHNKAWDSLVYTVRTGKPGFSVAKLLDIEVLVMGGGRERTIDEYKSLIGSVGLAVSKVIPTNRGPVLLECTME